MRHTNYLSGVYYCLIATMAWGGMFPVMTQALKVIDPFTFTSIRYTIAGIVFLLFLYMKEGPASFKIDGNKMLLWALGSAGFAGFGFFVFLGQQMAGPEGALSASMMMATMPFLGILLNWALRGTKPPMFTFGFIIMSLLGVLLVITRGDVSRIFNEPANYKANFVMIGGALCWVFYTIGASYFPKWSPVKYTAMSTLYGLPTVYAITAFLLATGVVSVPSSATVLSVTPELAYMSIIAGLVGVLCWNQGNKIITPLNGVLFMDVVPVTAFIVSTVLGVVPNNGQLFGIVLTASALVLNNLYQRRRLQMTAKLATA